MIDPTRGRIPIPNLDDRTWQDLVDEAKALIPTYAPQWTDTSASDLGITLIELFAWLVEGLTYRLNRVPEKNYLAFLNLLGITREPAVPAHTFLSFSTQSTVTTPVTVAKGTQAQTQGTEAQPPIIFETDEDLSVAPTNLVAILLLTAGASGTSYTTYTNLTSTNPNSPVVIPPANGYSVTVQAPSQPAQPVMLALGFDRQTTAPVQLRLSFFNPFNLVSNPASPQSKVAQATVSWSYSATASTTTNTDPSTWTALWTSAAPTSTSMLSDTTNTNTLSLLQDGTVIFTPPASWTSQTPTSTNQQPPQWDTAPASKADQVTNALFWLGITITAQPIPAPQPPPPTPPPPMPLQLGLKYILCNAVSAYNALTIPVPEQVGQSDGTPFQVLPLQHYPLFKRPNTATPYDHLVLQVTPPNGPAATWTLVDDFPAGTGNPSIDNCYRLNPVTGEVSFGNYVPTNNQQGHGAIPPTGSQITAQTYRYVAGGLAGMVGAGKITVLPDVKLLSTIASVINPISSYDAADQEAIADAKRRAPEVLRTRDRAVTAEDYEVLARETTSEVFLARCLEPRLQSSDNVFPPPPSPQIGQPWMFGNLNRSPGNVNVIVVPDQSVPQPLPSNELLLQVQSYLDTRRDLTAHLFVQGPRYLPIIVAVNILIWPNVYKANPLRYGPSGQLYNDTLNNIVAFFHPTRGGPDNTGWQIGQNVLVTDLFKVIMPSPDVGYITQLTVQADTPIYTPTTRPLAPLGPGPSVPLADYELVCSAATAKHTVTVNQVSTS